MVSSQLDSYSKCCTQTLMQQAAASGGLVTGFLFGYERNTQQSTINIQCSTIEEMIIT